MHVLVGHITKCWSLSIGVKSTDTPWKNKDTNMVAQVQEGQGRITVVAARGMEEELTCGKTTVNIQKGTLGKVYIFGRLSEQGRLQQKGKG